MSNLNGQSMYDEFKKHKLSNMEEFSKFNEATHIYKYREDNYLLITLSFAIVSL
jgi:hypothetical protein